MYAYVHVERVLHILHMHCCAEALYSAYGFSESAIMAARQIGLALPCTTNMHRTETPVLFVHSNALYLSWSFSFFTKVLQRQNLSDTLGHTTPDSARCP